MKFKLASAFRNTANQRWIRGHKARGQGQGHKKISRPRPRTQAQVFSKKRYWKNFFMRSQKKVFKIFFSGNFHLRKTYKGLRKFSARFLALSNKILTVQKIVLSSSQGQGNFWGLEASRPRPKPKTSKSVLEDVLKAKDVLENSTSAANYSTFNC